MSAFVVTEPLDVDRLRAELLHAIRKICPSWLASEAEDLAQLATGRVLDRLKDGSGVTLQRAYLYRVAYSVLVDEIRRRRRRPEVQIDPDFVASSGEPSPDRRLKAHEIAAAIRRCLSKLITDRRRAVTLHLLGHSTAEIVALLGWQRKQAENLIFRGMSDLRACLTAGGVTP